MSDAPESPSARVASRRPRSRRARRRLRRTIVVLLVVAGAIATPFVVHAVGAPKDSFALPSNLALSELTTPQRIVAIADSQVSYRTDPATSYCNKFSAYWQTGTPGCPGGERSEKWCADFAAWVWRHAGVRFHYGYDFGELNGAAASFYEWGVLKGRWHPVSSGYVPSPGDVALYGLQLGGSPWAAHLAIVTSEGTQGPDVVNGDGDRTGFSVVEVATNQRRVKVGHVEYDLAGYVSP